MLLLGLALQVEIVDMMQVETAINIEEIMHLCLSCSWKNCLSQRQKEADKCKNSSDHCVHEQPHPTPELATPEHPRTCSISAWHIQMRPRRSEAHAGQTSLGSETRCRNQEQHMYNMMCMLCI